MSSSPINTVGTNNPTTPATASSSNKSTSSTDSLANQNVFLQLLVAQLKNQDPQNPADGTAFVTQLAQFSELSNTTQMAADIATIKQELASQQATSSASTNSTGSTSN